MAINHLIARLGLDKTGFDVGLSRAKSSMVAFGSSLTAQLAGAFSVAAITQYIDGVAETVGRIKDLSEQFGITTDDVQKTDFAMQQSGMSIEELGASLAALGRHRRQAVEGNEELRKTFARYGLTLDALNDPQLRTFDVLMKIAAALKDTNINAFEQQNLMDLLGPRAINLTNILSELADVKVPGFIPENAIMEIDDATKALKALRRELDGIVASRLAGGARGFLGLIKGREGIADAFAQAIGGGFGDLLKGAFGVKENKADKLWEVDAAKKIAKVTTTSSRTAITSDQFQRIGAFTGAAAGQSQTELARRSLTVLEKMREDLMRRGILIRGTD